MNIDELKDAWKDTDNDELKIPVDLDQLQSALSPIEKIKRNMKFEFYIQLIGFCILGFYPFIFQIGTFFTSMYFLTYILFFSISVIYFIKFKNFFKYINHFTLNSKDSLYEIYYEIKVKIETYKSWNYAGIPFGIMIVMILGIGRMYYNNPSHFQKTEFLLNSMGLILGLSFFTFFVLFSLAVHYWINYFYGKHLTKIKKLIDELKEN